MKLNTRLAKLLGKPWKTKPDPSCQGRAAGGPRSRPFPGTSTPATSARLGARPGERLTRPGVALAVQRGLGVRREQVSPPELLPGSRSIHLGTAQKRDGSDATTGTSAIASPTEVSATVRGGDYVVFAVLVGEHLGWGWLRNLQVRPCKHDLNFKTLILPPPKISQVDSDLRKPRGTKFTNAADCLPG